MITIEMRIKQIRKTLKVSLENLAEKTGIERHYLAELENMEADEILLAEAILIAKALEVAIEELFVVKDVEIR